MGRFQFSPQTRFAIYTEFRRFRASKNYNTMIIQCVARLFVRVPYVGSLLKERGIQYVARLFVRVAYVGSLLIERGIHSV